MSPRTLFIFGLIGVAVLVLLDQQVLAPNNQYLGGQIVPPSEFPLATGSASSSSLAPFCGDGIVDAGERCDDGSVLNEDPNHLECGADCNTVVCPTPGPDDRPFHPTISYSPKLTAALLAAWTMEACSTAGGEPKLNADGKVCGCNCVPPKRIIGGTCKAVACPTDDTDNIFKACFTACEQRGTADEQCIAECTCRCRNDSGGEALQCYNACLNGQQPHAYCSVAGEDWPDEICCRTRCTQQYCPTDDSGDTTPDANDPSVSSADTVSADEPSDDATSDLAEPASADSADHLAANDCSRCSPDMCTRCGDSGLGCYVLESDPSFASCLRTPQSGWLHCCGAGQDGASEPPVDSDTASEPTAPIVSDPIVSQDSVPTSYCCIDGVCQSDGTCDQRYPDLVSCSAECESNDVPADTPEPPADDSLVVPVSSSSTTTSLEETEPPVVADDIASSLDSEPEPSTVSQLSVSSAPASVSSPASSQGSRLSLVLASTAPTTPPDLSDQSPFDSSSDNLVNVPDNTDDVPQSSSVGALIDQVNALLDVPVDVNQTGDSYCGDGELQADEQCEVGIDSCAAGRVCNPSICTCLPTAQLPFCGNGWLDENEQCDTGENYCADGRSCKISLCTCVPDHGCVDNDDCLSGVCTAGSCTPCAEDVECLSGMCSDSRCTPQAPPPNQDTVVEASAVCGDGVLATSEECDDKNRRDNDGCSSTCLLEIGICGDGIIQSLLGEQCEMTTHNPALPYSCRQCRFISLTCGDGVLDPGEACDEGEGNSTDPDATCRPDCSQSRCGDAVLDTTEQCDDGNRLSNDGCDRYCRSETESSVVAASTDADQGILPAESPFGVGLGLPFGELAQPLGLPQLPTLQPLPSQLPLAQLQPLIATHAPVGDTGPAAIAIIAAGAAAGFGLVRRKRK